MAKIIVALDSKNGIAKSGTTPWYLPADLAFFRQRTMGNDVIMGSKTFDQLKKPLTNRHTIVITKNSHYESVTCLNSFNEAMQRYPQSWVAGGASIYEQALPFVNELFITHIDKNYQCDLFFPKYQDDFIQVAKSDIIHLNSITYYHAQYIRR